MGIEKFIRSICVQTAIYWGEPENDGYGNMTFADPVEIPVRWDDSAKVRLDGKGKEYLCQATVMTPLDLEIHGMLRLGKLTDLDELEFDINDPYNLPGVFEILALDKIPMIKSKKEFVRTVYLGGRKG